MASFPWLAGQVSEEFSIDHFALKESAQEQPRVVTALPTVLCRLIVNLERNVLISIQFPVLLFTSHISPQTTSVTFTEETKL